MNRSAYARQRRRFSAGSIARRTSLPALSSPSSLSTWCSMGSPWQSQPGHVDGVVAQHRPRLDHDVLEDLVERGPHVDVPVRVGRAVVEDPAGAALPARPQLPVEVRRVPAAEELRLPLGQVRPHGEVGPREVEGRLVVHETGNCAAVVPPRSGRKRSIHAYLCQGTPPERAGGGGDGAGGGVSRRRAPDRPRARAPDRGARPSRRPTMVAAPATTLWHEGHLGERPEEIRAAPRAPETSRGR